MERGRNLTISGIGNANGGHYDEVRVDGMAKINDDIVCQKFLSNGTLRAKGDLEAGKLQVNGMATISGELRANHITIDGTLKTDDGISFSEFNLNGMATVGHHLMGESFQLEGKLNVHGNCEVERFEGSGLFAVDGLLNAGTIDVKIHGKCEAREIGCGFIKICVGSFTGINRMLGKFIPVMNPLLITEQIEGDDIYLENTEARIVRGNRVTIGPGCSIDRVEYKETFDCHRDASVGSYLKI